MLRAALFALLACCLAPAIADERADAQRQLEAAQRDIAELQKLLGGLQQEKSGIQKQLQGTEREMGTLQQQIDALEQQLKDGESEIQRLDEEKKKLQSQRAEQQKLIAIQIRAAHQSGGQEYLKLLLNQQRPEQFSRNLTYHDYLSRARSEQLASYNDTLRQLHSVEADLATQHALLAGQQLELQDRRSALDKVRDERRSALAKLNSELGDGDRQLKSRQREQAQLAKVLKTIEETLARQAREAEQARQLAEQRAREEAERRLAAASDSGRSSTASSGPLVSSNAPAVDGPFAKARGQLPWPVDGRLLARFGTPRGDARLKWDGVLIGAAAGTRVRAIHAGRVVFADWLRGAGMLLIVDHGGGYLSLYGHNQTLLKAAGDQVKAGEAIATVGSSGGQDTPALYFAIRQQGQPSDPLRWCRAQG
ncbi:Septal ring factor EnvC, activator of murein hydrolases AmiA and AmiB [Pseudomonas linyingensis]|uniref:Septal ring factor EnvC, activator of murein hydrolases AmiA and AmiB n=1 Tax=Pseudomonas linyingensis TaxID=915471 RepID=A0A1H6THY4_9PSED|nr:murein hydrolase activator EnvC [Pseudomonas linyingensis]SEI75815.1 Septal ring factor EnvC, activator of murein hydrolases AmiA and AmiB [Pseudomonas linyingensis]